MPVTVGAEFHKLPDHDVGILQLRTIGRIALEVVLINTLKVLAKFEKSTPETSTLPSDLTPSKNKLVGVDPADNIEPPVHSKSDTKLIRLPVPPNLKVELTNLTSLLSARVGSPN